MAMPPALAAALAAKSGGKKKGFGKSASAPAGNPMLANAAKSRLANLAASGKSGKKGMPPGTM